LSEYPALGYLALGLAALAVVALLVMLARIGRDILQERRIARLQEQAQAVLAGADLAAAKALADQLGQLYASRPETAKGRAALRDSLPNLFAGRDVLAVAERSLLVPLDAQVQVEIAKAARQVSVVTAVSPRAIVDMLFVLVACARLLRRIAAIYGGRPGALGLFRLARNVIGHLAITGGIAAGDAVIQQLLGQGLAARLSAKLGEGVLNGLLTARVGLSAIALCRPLPFHATKAPGLSDVAGDLVSWRGPKAGD
jgi:putative membrane protein